MDLPRPVLEAVRAAVDANPGDLNGCVEAAVAAVRTLPEYPSLVDALVHQAVQGAVYEERHRRNTNLRRQAGVYGRAGVTLDAPAVARAYTDIYGYYIAGTRLGDLAGEELEAVQDGLAGKASELAFQARLIAWLRPRVRPGQRVRDAIPERRLWRAYRDIRAECGCECAKPPGDNSDDAA